MRRPARLGTDPLVTVTFFGGALIASAVFLGALRLDGGAPGSVELAIVVLPLLAVAAYAFSGSRSRPPDAGSPLEEAAVGILIAEVDDPTITIDPDLSIAAADLLSAVGEPERRTAERQLRRLLSRAANRGATRPSG